MRIASSTLPAILLFLTATGGLAAEPALKFRVRNGEEFHCSAFR